MIKINLHKENDNHNDYMNNILKQTIGLCKPCTLENHYCEGGVRI